ncbi:hypothetical protein FRC07_001554 [Ceratobasidium sp. 392]|nr:hypothetical protein FRC07_001554 [Ceratobasidium sp. 392]
MIGLLDALSERKMGYTDPFDGLSLDLVWTSTQGRLGGLAPDLFKLADRHLATEPIASSPLTEDEEGRGAVEVFEDSEAGPGLDYMDPFDGLDPDALWIPPTRAHLGGLAADMFRTVDRLLVDEPATSSSGIMNYAAEHKKEGATRSEAMITGDEEHGTPEVEDPFKDNDVSVAALETSEALVKPTVDALVEDRTDVVDPLDGNTDSVNRPLGSCSDEPFTPDVQPGLPTLEQPDVLPANNVMDSHVADAVTIDKWETRSGRRARAWRDQNTAVENSGALSSGRQRGRRARSARNSGTDNGTDNQRPTERSPGRNSELTGGSNTGGGEGGEGGGGRGGASAQIPLGGREGGEGGSGSLGVDNRPRGGGIGEQSDARRGEAGIRRAPLNTDFLRRLLQQSANAGRN